MFTSRIIYIYPISRIGLYLHFILRIKIMQAFSHVITHKKRKPSMAPVAETVLSYTAVLQIFSARGCIFSIKTMPSRFPIATKKRQAYLLAALEMVHQQGLEPGTR